MEARSEVKKGKRNIEDVIGSHTPQAAESESRIEVVDDVFKELFMTYEKLLGKLMTHVYVNKDDFIHDPEYGPYDIEPIRAVLTPAQINTFLQATRPYEDGEHYAMTTGFVVSRLIQQSFRAKNNDFFLDTTHLKPIDYIGYNIDGRAFRNLRLHIEGDVGDYCASEAKHITFTLQGNAAKKLGGSARESELTVIGNAGTEAVSSVGRCEVFIEGDVGSYCGSYARDSQLTIKGNTGDRFGNYTKKSRLLLEGDTGIECGVVAEYSRITIKGRAGRRAGHVSTWCCFKTDNHEALANMVKSVPEFAYGGDMPNHLLPNRGYSMNGIAFIHPDGKEENIKDYLYREGYYAYPECGD
jgi:hypothetical protein